MTLFDRLRALADAPDGLDLAAALGVAGGDLSIRDGALTVAGEVLDLADCRRALAGEPPRDPAAGRRTVTIGDLCPTNSPS